MSAKLDMEYGAKQDTSFRKALFQSRSFARTSDLDTNYHVNNCQYVCMAEDYLPEQFYLQCAEYKKQARLGCDLSRSVCGRR